MRQVLMPQTGIEPLTLSLRSCDTDHHGFWVVSRDIDLSELFRLHSRKGMREAQTGQAIPFSLRISLTKLGFLDGHEDRQQPT